MCVPHTPTQVSIIIRSSLVNLLEVGLDEAKASAALLDRVDSVLAWVAKYMGPEAQAKGVELGGPSMGSKTGVWVWVDVCGCGYQWVCVGICGWVFVGGGWVVSLWV
jgi:hypothetical protein